MSLAPVSMPPLQNSKPDAAAASAPTSSSNKPTIINDDSRRGSSSNASSSENSSGGEAGASSPSRSSGGSPSASASASNGNGQELLSKEQVLAADKIEVKDDQGRSIRFGEIRKGKKTILLFVRHQHCGMCRAFLTGLNEHAAFRNLAAHEQEDGASVQVIIISQGQWKGIARYRDFTGPFDAETGEQKPNPFRIYSSADKKLFNAFGVTKKSLSLGKEEEVAEELKRQSVFQNVISSIRETIGSGRGLLQGGEFSLLGADVIIEADGTPSFIHRMQSTRDHTSADKLAKLAHLSA